MNKITTAYGQTIALEVDENMNRVLTLRDSDSEILAQIGMTEPEYYTLLGGIEEETP